MKLRPLAFSAAVIAAAVSVSCGSTQVDEPIELEVPVSTSASVSVTTSVSADTTAVRTTLTDKKTTAATVAESAASTAAVTTGKANDSVQVTDPPAETEQQPEELETEPEIEKQEETVQSASFSIDDLLSDAGAVISSLGSPDEKYTANACTKNGSDITVYKYPGLEIQSYKNDSGNECICSILITSDTYNTKDGVKVGSSRSTADSAWGSGVEEGRMTYYFFGQKEIDVEFSGDTVSSINFYCPV